MQFPGSSLNPSNAVRGLSPQKKLAFIIFGGLALITLVLVLVARDKPSSDPPNLNEYYDAASGETVSSPEGKSPETFGVPEEEKITFLGFSKLLDVGVTQLQVEASQIALSQYSETRAEKITEVSVHVASIKRLPFESRSGESKRQVNFDITINRKDTYQATLEYTRLQSASLRLAQSGQEVFHSIEINPEGYFETHGEVED